MEESIRKILEERGFKEVKFFEGELMFYSNGHSSSFLGEDITVDKAIAYNIDKKEISFRRYFSFQKNSIVEDIFRAKLFKPEDLNFYLDREPKSISIRP